MKSIFGKIEPRRFPPLTALNRSEIEFTERRSVMEHRRGKLRAMSEFTLTEAWRFCATRRQQAIPVRSAASLECTVNPCNSAPSEERGCQSLRLETRKHKRRNSIRPRSNDHNLRGTDPRMELGLVRETAYVTSYVHVASGTGYFAQAK